MTEPRVVDLDALGDATLVHESAAAVTRFFASGDDVPSSDAWVTGVGSERAVLGAGPGAQKVVADGGVVAYRAVTDAAASHPADPFDLTRRPDLGNAFEPLFESTRVAAGLVSVKAGAAVDVGPESERTWVVLSGSGLVFLEYEVTLPLQPRHVAVVPAGDAARLWSRGPADLRVVALQPQGAPQVKRNLASEVARRKAAANGG